MLSSADLHHVYVSQTAADRVEKSKVGCIIALIFMPLGASVDWVIYPEQIIELTIVRILCVLCVLAILPLHFLNSAKKYIKPLNLSYPIVIVVAMCTIIMLTEGLSGPYYAGLSMLILGVSLLLPLSFLEALFFVIFTISCYIGFGYFWQHSPDPPILIFNNLYFLTATGIIATLSSYFSEKGRFREFQLTYQLDQRNRELAELDRMKSDFYANISHEFRTPLTLILAPIEDLVANGKFDERAEGYIRHIRENAYRLLKLVNDLLDVQKLEEKKDFLESQPVKLNGLLANICSGMESLAKRQVINLVYTPFEKDIVVQGDQSALEKVFINLINNAIKFTEAGGQVEVSLKAQGRKCIVLVSDTGTGISRKDLPFIFERFRQADSSSTKKQQGTGLGLALVKELTQLHNGDIHVASEVGRGTTMAVSLPILTEYAPDELADEPASQDALQQLHRTADQTISEDEPKVKEVAEPEPVTYDQGKELPKLLIVEDEAGIRDYLQDIFEADYHLFIAEDGAKGLYLAQREKPDLIILDWMLPKMDGLSICAAVKEDRVLKATKVLLLTAKTDEQSKLRALEQGADDFLTKPFSTVEIKSRIANMWQTSQLQRDVEKQNTELQETLTELKETQGKLIQSEKLNALGRLAAGLLHEVNNPLNFAFATFQLLEREESVSGDEYAQELMKDIRVGMERIAGIVKDLKAFAYPETSDLQANFNLSVAAESALRFTRAKTTAIEIKNLIEEQMVAGSQSHIVQVLVNLIENAADAMENEKVNNQTITLDSKMLQNGRIQISVTDNGPGIPKEIQGKIFDPFYTTKDVGSGMGMGLSICHTIIGNHHGLLAVDSQPGKTTFTFDLGLLINNEQAPNSEHLLDSVSGE